MNKPKQKTREDEQFEIRFLEGVLRESPNFIEALIQIGDLYTKHGFFEKGLVVDQRLSALRPADPTVLYNLACSYSLTGQLDKALVVLQSAVNKGYEDLDYLRQDKDLENLHRYPPFQEYFLKLRNKTKKTKKIKKKS